LLGASLHFGAGLHYSDTRLTEVHCEERRPSVDPSRVLLEAKDVCVDYRAVRAVDGVSFDVRAGETVGLVGESGCGKSSLSGALTRLIEPTRGSIVFDGEDVTHQSRHALRPYRRRVQMIFQDPYGSLNPRHTVERTLGLALSIHGVSARRERDAKIRRIVDAVGLPASALRRYPHEFSGGQRQRIGIARALVLQPELVICDDSRPAHRPQERIQPRPALHLARSLGGALYRRSRARHAGGADRRKRQSRFHLDLAATPLYAHPDRRGAVVACAVAIQHKEN
jgi:peptide/nickel transport system ATP-binding protein